MAHPSSARDASLLWKTYVKEQEVGHGRYAKVYKAKEVGTDSILAVKVFNKLASAAEDVQRRQAVKNEVRMLDAARHGVGTAVPDSEVAVLILLPSLTS